MMVLVTRWSLSCRIHWRNYTSCQPVCVEDHRGATHRIKIPAMLLRFSMQITRRKLDGRSRHTSSKISRRTNEGRDLRDIAESQGPRALCKFRGTVKPFQRHECVCIVLYIYDLNFALSLCTLFSRFEKRWIVYYEPIINGHNLHPHYWRYVLSYWQKLWWLVIFQVWHFYPFAGRRNIVAK